jgi:phosphopantothenoylcysteine decarboxylase/phosphopantothenate--cysteine ligase
MAAAVADYQVAEGPAGGKISKSREDLAISLEPTTDILCEVASEREDQFVIGFAAEYGPEGLARARAKLERKNLNMIVFNDISRHDIGFNSDYNEVVILTPSGELPVSRAPKETVAEIILDHVARSLTPRRPVLAPVS